MRRKYARFPVRICARRLLEPRIACELDHVIDAFRIPAILRRDRGQMNPVLQPFRGFAMSLPNLRLDVAKSFSADQEC